MILAELFPYANVVYNVLTALYFITVLTVIVVVLSENRNPVKSMAWMLVLVLLPVVGLGVYLFFGRSLKGVNMISRASLRQLRRQNDFPDPDVPSLDMSEESRQLVSLVNTVAGPHLFVGNDIEVFTTGKDKIEALFEDLRQATDYIHLQYFILEYDHVGKQLCDLLIARAQAGVKVRVLYDYVGSFPFKSSVLKQLRQAGVEAHPFLEVTLTQLANRINWRNHRKVVVIDGKVGYIGGMNIADRYVTGDGNRAAWRDTHLRITGEVVAALQYSFAIDWEFTTRHLLTEKTVRYNGDTPPSGGCNVQMVASGPTSRWNNISFVFLKAIMLAKRRVYIQTPYFLPSDALLKALQSAALSGVDVRVMLPRRPDSRMLRLATGSYIKESILSGIKIYFYEPAMMHAKVLLIDDDFVTTGSTNFDFRSFEHNFEINALVYDRQFNEKMAAIYLADEQQCTRVALAQWKRRPLVQKALESVVRLISPIL